MASIAPQLPRLARAINLLGAPIAGRAALRFDPQRLLQRATEVTGLRDFAPDPQFSEGLDVLCRSIEDEVHPTPLGRLLLREIVLRALTNRLLLVHHRRCNAARLRTPLPPPLIILGNPRSGTTLLHRLLALDPQARALAMWEVQRPLPPLGRDRRRAQVRTGINVLRWAAVDLDVKHPTSGDSVEECMLLLDTSLVSLSFWVFAPVYSYLAWWQRQDKSGPYQIYRELLSFLQSQTPAARLTLKAPAHTGCLAALLRAVPDAMIIQTHRDPGVVVPSVNSLFSSIHHTMTDRSDPARLGEQNAALLLSMAADNARARAALGPSARIHDVRYDDLTRDPTGVIQGIYQRFGLPFTPQLEALLARARAEDDAAQRGQHRYRAEDFGQSADALRERFAPYIRTFLDPHAPQQGGQAHHEDRGH